MLSKARSLLARLRASSAPRQDEARFDGRMEELEPRILFSADAAGALLDPTCLPAAQMEQVIQQVMPPLAADTRQTQTTPAGVAAEKEVLFLDMNVGDADSLLADLMQQQSRGRPIDIVQIKAGEDGINVITDYLKAQNESIGTIHVISHGDTQGLQLGATRLDLTALTTRLSDITTWSENLTEKADVLLYGCNLALGAEGRELIDQLGLLTGADVAASDDYTGAALMAGDWVLEYTTGQVDSATALTVTAQNEWSHVLATTSFREGASSYAGTSDTWIDSATPDTNNGAQGTIAITDNSSMQVLIKFDNIFGTGSGQIPYGSTITTATLTVYTTQDGTGNPAIYRVISNNWSESSTWNSLSGGISLDNVEASSTAASSVDVSTNNTTDIFTNLASTVQLWASGTANYGWVIVDDGNEWNFSSSENGTAANRPILNVTYTAPTPPSLDLDASGVGSNFSTTFTENGAAVKIADTDASVTAGSNTISTNLSAMTVTISNLLDGTAESLAATTTGTNITASYDSGTGVLSLTGSDTAANYQTVLRTVTYNNSDDTPTTTSRSITVVATDPYGGNSSTVTCTMAITVANDAPVITSNGGDTTATISVAETITAVTTVTSTDPEGTARTYSIVAGNDGAKFSIGAGTGVLTFVSAPDFESPTDSNADNVYVVTVQASDGSLTDTQTISVTVTDVGSTLVVDTTSDSNDTGLGSSFTAEQLNATKGTDGKVSLREAIIAANTTAGTDTVSFNIASGSAGTGADTGAYVITTSSGALPTIGEAITIDASTQSGYVAGGLHTVVLDGNDAAAYGLNLNNAADGSTIRGLVIRNFTSYGVYIQSGSDGNTIAGNFIGSFYADGSDKGSGFGNASTGIFSHGANTVIGGTSTADRNVVSGNPAGYNIYLGTGSTGSTVKGNYVGLNAAGTAVFSTTNPDYGILVESTSTNITIGGTDAGSGNVVSGHTREGMWITTSGTVTIQGNYIGTDVTGTVDLGNTRYGIYLDDTGNATIGGSSAGAGNLISGNNLGGIYAANTSVTVQGNIIGLNASGTAALANSGSGIEVRTSGVSTIGGNGSSYRNVISGNTSYGIDIETSPTGGHVVKGNYIGVGSDGTTLLGNGSAGIYINAYYATIGGKTSGDGNIIAGNGGAGIAVAGGHTNLFYRNSIYSNTGLGVDLGNDGVTANDYNDGDGGANYLTNYPTITSVVTNGSSTTISGSIDWYQGGDTVYIELFSSPSKDASGYGEGKTYLGAAQVTTTSGTGDATFSLTVTGVSVGDWITAIANVETSFPGASEFSKAVQAVAPANAPRGRVIWNTNDRFYQYYANWSTAGFGEIGTNGLNLGDDISMISAAEAPTRNEILFIGSADASGQILAAIWNGSTWSSVISIPVASPSATASLYDSFAVAYDQISGDAMLIWDNGNTGTTGLSYATWNGTSWSATSTITAPISGEPVHMKLAANPIGHDMVLAVETTAASNNQYAIVWNGSSWGNSQTLGSNSSKQYFELNVAYEAQSGHAMAIYDSSASDSASVQYRVWNGSSWGSEGTVTAPAGVTAASELYNTAIASDPGSNRIAIAAKNAANETWLAVWDGSAWGSTQLATTSGLLIGDYHATMAVAFESQSGDLLAVYGKASGPNLYYRTWTSGGGWSAEGTGPSVGGTDVPYISKLYSDPYSNTIMLGVQDNASDLNMVTWDGSAWGTVTELDNSTAHTYRENFTYVWFLNAPVVANIAGDTLAYTEDQSAQVIDQGTAATVTMGDETAYNGGNLTVSFTAGSTSAEDVLGIRDQGTGAGQIGVSGANVTYAGTTIGTYAGGSSGSNLVITLNGNASNAAVTALIKNITYQNTNTSAPSTSTRTARFVVTNAMGEASANHDVSITVTAVNDAPVNTVPSAQTVNEDATLVFSTGNSNLISIADVDAGGSQVQVTISVDHGTLSLSGITGLSFSVGDGTSDSTMTFTGTTSAINTALSGLAYAPTANYNGSDTLTITTSDQGNTGTGGTQTDVDTVAITVTAVNDAPVISSNGGGASASINTAENTTGVTTVTATDVDSGATQTYSISGGADAAKFSINSSTGVLTFVSAPDFENPTDSGGNNVYDVIVQVSDGSATDTQAMAITVTDANDNAPVISSDGGGASATKNVAENGTAVTTVTATDVDTGTTLTYSISGGVDSAKFSINSSTGVLTFVSAPDYESPTDAGGDNVYDVTVQVSDGTNTDTQAIAVTVTDLNDNAPVITSDGGGASATKNVAENGTAVTTVTATDVDTGTTLTYSITGGADSAKFSINSSTGVLTFVSAPDYESPTDAGTDNVYDVTVQVSDGTNTDTQTIAVTVTDLNDNAPVITSDGGGASASKNVAENGTAVTTVTATDVDTGTTLTYSISGGADSAKFSINSSTGVLTFVSAPDYESPTDAGGDNVYDVTVQVSDGTNTDTQTIAVTVTDLNDNAPVITSDGGGASATKNIAENGTAVTTVTATDVDTGTTLTYSITGGADSAKFSINSSTGVLTFVSAPNYESPTDSGGDNVYDVTVQVSDGTNTDTQAIAVTVTDLNDNAPVITSDGGGASATKNVAENGTAVTTVTATDVDTGTTLTYSITGGADSAKFSINSSTGVLTFVSAPNYESPTDAGGDNVYDVTVQVSDGTNTDTQSIAVTVTDLNDNAPVITSDGGGASATKNVAENGTAVTTVTATDVDTGTTLTYSITGGADSAKFSINSSTGVLTFVSAPDYESPTDAGTDNVYDVTVQVSDGTNTDTQTIAVTVTDLNDNAPVITSDGGGASATKNVAENGTAVTTVTATDVDTGTTLTYSITGGADSAKFSINSSTGVLTFVSAPDYEVPTDAGGDNVYDVTVQVSDGTNTDTQAIAVTVTDLNDNAPVITSDGGGASSTKNVAENGTAVTTVTATDVDTGTTLTYSITGGADSAKFSINSSTGVLTFVSAPDYESPTDAGGDNIYDVTVQVSDGTNTDTQAIAVTVTDLNDNAPAITSDGGGASATKNVAENGTAVTTVTATDVDTGTTLTYSISGGADAAKFSINASTGVLTFVAAPDYESPTDSGGDNVYDVTVQVSDGTNADTQAIAVTVTDLNDSAPVITSDAGGASATKNVAENGTTVTTVTATDVDTGTTLTYSITGGADSAKFSINSSTGLLTFVSAPDYESPTDAGGDNVYDVTVQVNDGTNTDTQSIAVTVTDVNDNAPVISSDGGGASATKNVSENGTAVTTVTATDVDTGTTLTYSITGGADSAKFSINSSTGVLTFVSAPDYEVPTDAGSNNVYDVTVQVSDGTNTDTQAIAVTITDVNDSAPVITSDGGGASAAKNVAENGTAVTTVTATDVDTGTTLTYSIAGGADSAKFSINSSTGVLTFVSAPDYESPTDAGGNNVYDVTVQVSDGTNTDTQAIAVTVTDVNDNAPVISSDGGGASATKNIAENGTAVTTVTATDVDTGTTLTYSITGGADSAKFSINSSTGVLTFVSAPDYESPTDAGGDNVYDVTVQVSDGTNADTQSIAVTVTDLNDNAPVITSDGGGASATKNVAENGTAVTTVTATDVDTGTTLTYSISGGADSAKFSINASTGVLTFVSAPDYESPTDAGGNNVYDVTVQVSDGTNTDTQAIAVTVTDLNDNAPVITSDGGGASATKNVAENSTAVTTVTATDVDTGTTLTYSISGGTDSAKFSINSSTGVLTFVSAPDYEMPTDAGGDNVYDVTVQVSDGTNTDTQAIAVTVTDVNDNAPVITSDGGGASATKNIAENGTAVTTVTSTDVDTSTTLTYSITGGADSAKFSINSSTGVLTFVSAPDYEVPTDAGGDNVYDVTVQVSDGTNTDTQAIAVTVTDLNDNAPVITSDGGGASATKNVAENGTAVTTVTATDVDTGTTLTYSITGGADSAKFSINSSTGVLTFVSASDYEVPTDTGGDNVYDVTVQVSDGTNTDTQTIAVTVTDLNDNAPVITSDGGGASATKNVTENGTAVTTVTATDVDTGTTLTYSISGGADSAKFSINSSTGVLTFVSAPDYEVPTDAGGDNVYDVTVQVSDGTNTDTQAIAVTVTDLNDNAPVITSDGGGASATKNVAENGTAVTTVTATDVDTGTTLTYSISGGADAAKFSINSSTGVLTFVAAPDYESPTDSGGDNVYDVTVQVSDGTNTDTQAIAVTVTDLNDNAPVITSDGGGTSATKNVAENGTAVTTVTATDVDTGTTLTYSITGGADSAKFSINSATGVLTFVSAPNYENPTDTDTDNIYDVTVQVSDGTNTDTQTIAVTVTDLNDNAPVITSDGGGASATKNVAENGTAVTTVTATDVDTGTTLTYSISGGADSAKFSINASTGVLTFVSAPDYESPTDAGGNNVYDVTVQVSDGTNTDTQAIAVTVTDLNDNAPVITSDGGGASATKNVAENGTAVTTVTATDVDTGTTLTYSISGGADSAKFSINASTGVLTFVSAPDYESPTDAGGNNVYDVTVQVSDGTNTDTQAIAVTVTDLNDNAPVITSDGGGTSATKNVAENGTAVTTVTATDVDTGTTLTYSITGGADSAKFSINSSTGVLTFVAAPDYESPTDSGGDNVYDVTVQVSDGTNTDTQAMAVTVTDVSDNAPVITSDGGGASATKNVAENGTAVTTVTATDVDTGTTLTYSITGGADSAKFSINSSTGVLTFVSAPNYESPTDAGGDNVYDVTVQVSDGTNTDTQAIAVTVTDLNDNAPVITSDGGGASATKNVAENGTAVTTVTATDVDTGTTLTYSISGGADSAKFSINSSTGVLTFVSAPDYEVPTDAGGDNVYDVTVQVSDGTNTDTQAIAVTVTDVNDNAPVISSDGGGASATKNVAENSTAVTTVTATDVDTGTTLTYSITGGADAAKFSINSSTGVLTFVSAPDYESPTDAGGNNVYDVTVQVSDGTNTDTQTISVAVTDLNDSAPVITSDGGGASATKNVTENGTAVTTVTATDADTGTTLTYNISGGADAAKFSINSSTGALTFVSAPDHESPTDAGGNNVYDVTVQVSDGTNTDTQSIAVTVTDLNDNAPVISSDGGGASATKNVAENSTAVTTVTATDVDTGTTLTYSITGGADSAKFSINSSTGALTFVSAPDYESPTDAGGNNVYDVTVQVSDGANTDTQTIAVTVTDLNDNAPVITSDGGGASATKNVTENGTAVTTVTATDIDTGTTLTYSITGGADAAKFSINSATGVLTFVSAPDYESPTDAGGNNVYDITVQVSDGTNTDSQSIAVTITDVNDNAPIITSDGGGASATKNVAENGTAVTTVTATDVDTGTTLTYSISGGADSAKFSINSSTGVLTFVSAPDYESPTDAGSNNVYDVTVQVSDGTNTDSQSIAVTITDVNDNAPVITSDGGGASATKNVAENGTAVTTVTATDVDTGTTLTYSITGGADSAKFSINASTGVLTFVSAPDFESPTDAGSNNVYDVTVQVSDGTNTDTQAIAVTVTDVNDNAPVITSDGGGTSATKNVTENGTAVTTVTATDVDTGATLTYSITGGADAAKFNINSSMGALTFVSAPDHEAPTDAGGNNVYDVTVQVSDGTNTDTQAIAITVTDVNDSAPVITSDGGGASATKNVAENGTAVTTVTATDVDTGTTLTYSITGGADAAKFSINSATGVLTFLSAPDHESPTDAGSNNVYDLTVQVSDGTHTDNQAIAVTVTGVNESPTAQMTLGIYNATEKLSLTLQGTGIQIADPDALNGTVQAQLSVSQGILNVAAGNAGISVTGSGSNTVSITGTLTQINQLLSGSSTGSISYINNQDLPSPTDTLTLTVNDLGNTGAGTALSDSASATINVTAVNDSPIMSAITLTANAAPSASWASSSLLNGTIDPDGDPLSIRVLQGPQHGTLTISGSGQVTYTTDTGYVGSDSFSYVAFDGQASSSNVRVMSIQASSPVVDMGPSTNTSNTDSPPTKVDTSTKNDSDTSTPKPGKTSEPKPVPEDPIVVAPPSRTDAPDGTEVASIDALLHHLTSGTWTPGRLSDNFGMARQIFFEPPAGSYVTSTASSIANAPSVMQLLDLIRPNLEHAPDINLSLTPLSGVTHALPAGHLGDADAAESDSGRAPIHLTKIATYSSGLGLSIGTIWWTARMSGLVTSALISTPAWRSLDPLPVVTSPTDEQDDEHDGDSRLGDREVEHLFDGDKPLEQDMPIIQ